LLNLDADAKKLAERLDGLPLALATADDYICQTADQFDDYLQMYEQSWKDLIENSDDLMEYDNRTLYSTWNLSLKQVAAQDPEAAKMFRLMGYLGNADLWYELFREGAGSAPDWLCNITKSKARFNKAMATLHGYSLIEAMPGHYSLHACVHDWVLECLIGNFDITLFGLATHCIAQNVAWDSIPKFWVINGRLNHHALRIEHCQQREIVDWNVIDMGDIYRIGYLDSMTGRLKEAETMYVRALKGYEKAWGAEHTSTLNTVNNLGLLYADQGKMAEAKTMYVRALNGKEKAWGVEHTSTLNTVNNLGSLYADQGKMAKAKIMYVRALKGKEKAWGAKHTSTLNTVNNLGTLYADQDKMAEAEEMFEQVLEGFKKIYGVDHPRVLVAISNLSLLKSARK
jgi:tetratricopeptide (TPR) repeat protein